MLRGGQTMRGRITALRIQLTEAEREALLKWHRAHTRDAGQARRAWAILLLAQGVSITAAAARVGKSRRYIYRWAARFQAASVAGLADKRRARHADEGSGHG
jgi:hypothetical protein